MAYSGTSRCSVSALSGLLFSLACCVVPVAAQSAGTAAVELPDPAVATEGESALRSGAYSEGYAALEQAAEAGTSTAANALASAYFVGLGRPANFAKAINYAKLSAEAGDVVGLRTYGWMLLHGLGAPANPRMAMEYFEKAAVAGDIHAMYLAGRLKEQGGAGMPADAAQAASWYELAALQSYPAAFWRLGAMKIAGSGGAQDFGFGTDYLRKAAEAGVPEAIAEYGHQVYLGEGEIQDYAKALQLYMDAGDLAVHPAKTMAGYMLERGLGIQADSKAAQNLYFSSAMLGYPPAMYNLGRSLANTSSDAGMLRFAHAMFNLAAADGLDGASARREELERRLNGEDVKKAQALARSWRIEWDIENMTAISSGTGFFISIGGAVVTNHHVVSGCSAWGIRIGEQIRPAALTFAVREVDLALLHLLPQEGVQSDFQVAQIANSDEVFVGERVTVFGWPYTGTLSSEGVLTTGSLSADLGLGDDPRFIQISAPVQSGNSGGAILGETGKVVGVVRAVLQQAPNKGATAPQNVNFGVKHEVLKDLLGQHGQRYYSDPTEEVALTTRQLATIGREIGAQVLCYEPEIK